MPRSACRFDFLVRLTVCALLLAISACESASTNVVAPATDKCSVTAANSTGEIPASGGNGTITVTTSRDCTWSASAQTSWISLTQTSGQGPASLPYSVQPNAAGIARHSGVTVEQQAVDIVQAAAPCRYQASPANVDLDPSSRQLSIAVAATDGCHWTARADSPWIVLAAPTDGTGSGTVQVQIAANTGAARAGNITIGTATVALTQAAPAPPAPTPTPTPPTPAPTPAPTPTPPTPSPTPVPPTPTPTPTPPPPTPPPPTPTCTYALAQTTVDVTAAAQNLTDSVTTTSTCTWTVSSDASWITVSDGRSGSGNGTFQLSIAANSGAARSGTVHVAGLTVTVRQAAAACAPAIKPTSYDAGRGPDNISVNVTADTWCTWTTVNTAGWVTVTAGASGTGNGTVRLSIPANDGPVRNTVLTIAGNAFSLKQEPGCQITIKPTSYDAGRGPDTVKIAVTAGAGCSWTATSPVSWVSVTQGASGTGNGTVVLAVEPNSGPARSATLTIGGQSFAITQKGAN